MELVMASLLTHLDHPDEVMSGCTVNRKGLPHHFAPALVPDIVVQPADDDPPFQIVCEVSANREMTDEVYLGQLEETLRHAREAHDAQKVAITYGLVANLRKIGEEKRLQDLYRNFLTDPNNGLDPHGPIRIVPFRAPEFGTVVRRLDAEDQIAFDSQLFARVLDGLHEKFCSESVPGKEDWMAEAFVGTVRAGLSPSGDLFDTGP